MNDFEIAFHLDDVKRTLTLPDWAAEQGLGETERALRKRPGDLALHWLRIGALLDAPVAPGRIYAALADLKTVLGSAGARLKERLRNRCLAARPDLDAGLVEQVLFLMDGEFPKEVAALMMISSTPSDTPENSLPPEESPSSERRAEPETAADVLTQAREALEYGDLENARDILEQAVAAGADDPDVHEELLTIYRVTRDLDRFRNLYRRLDLPPALDTAWRESETVLAETTAE